MNFQVGSRTASASPRYEERRVPERSGALRHVGDHGLGDITAVGVISHSGDDVMRSGASQVRGSVAAATQQVAIRTT